MVAVLFGIVFTATDIIIILVLTRGGPYDSTQVLVSKAFYTGVDAGDLATGAATALFLFPLLAAVAIGQIGVPVDRDAIRVQWTRQLRRVSSALNIRYLRCRKGHYAKVLVIAKVDVEVVKVAAGSPGNHNTLWFVFIHYVKSPGKVGYLAFGKDACR